MVVGTKRKTGLMTGILAAMCLLLSSCTSAPLLSQREIVHAVFFQQQGSRSTVLLLLADSTQPAEAQETAYRTVTGSGENPAQALERAENSLDGQVFYGLMDLAVLPVSSDWQQAEEIARLLYDKTKPAPQIVLFMLPAKQGQSLVECAPALYAEMESAQQRYGLQNGLQMMFSQQNECALPVWQGTGYGFAFLQKGKSNTVIETPLPAQLVAVLAGQADRLDCCFDQGKAAIQTQVSVQHEADASVLNALHLTLGNPEIVDMSGEYRDQSQLQQTLCRELTQAFAAFVPGLYADRFDPLRTRVWVAAASGFRVQEIPAPQLVIHLET